VPGLDQQARRLEGHQRAVAVPADAIGPTWLALQDQRQALARHRLDRSRNRLAAHAVRRDRRQRLLRA